MTTAQKSKEEVKKSGKVGKVDINKLINKVRAGYGKEKALASQITTGSSITKPSRDEDFILWDNSPWSLLTGLKGLAFGKVHQIAGRPDSGKSSMAMQFMKNAQDQGVLVILWDSEGKFSVTRYDKYFGGNSADLVVVTSRMILEGADEIEKIINAAKDQDPSAKILICWDSVGGSLSISEGDNSLLEGKQLAAAAKENGAAVRSFVRQMEKWKNKETNEETIAVLLINQVYANIGSPGQKESGGQKVEYFSSIILQLTRKKDLTKMKDKIKRKIGIVTRAKVKKNHLFDGEDTIAELDLAVTAASIKLLTEAKEQSPELNDDASDDEESDDE